MQQSHSWNIPNRVRVKTLIGVSLCVLMLGGCASAPMGQVYDPIEKVNRATFAFNDYFDRILLKPLSQGYTAVVPKKGRVMVSNFFDNATYADTILNDFLQGKGGQGVSDIGRFVINTTLGVGGLFDPATPIGLKIHDEDFGQTLGVWGFGPGAYVVVPVYGPHTVRGLPHLATGALTSALFWSGFIFSPAITIPLAVLSAADLRSRASNAIRFVNESALDPYVFTREAWVQHRNFLVYDGDPPETVDEFSDEDFSDEDANLLK